MRVADHEPRTLVGVRVSKLAYMRLGARASACLSSLVSTNAAVPEREKSRPDPSRTAKLESRRWASFSNPVWHAVFTHPCSIFASSHSKESSASQPSNMVEPVLRPAPLKRKETNAPASAMPEREVKLVP